MGSSDLSPEEKKQQYSRLTVSPQQPVNTAKRAFNNARAWQRRGIPSNRGYFVAGDNDSCHFSSFRHVYLPSRADVPQSGVWPLFPFLPSCSDQLFLPCFRWDDGPGKPPVLHTYQPVSRYQTGAARRCVSAPAPPPLPTHTPPNCKMTDVDPGSWAHVVGTWSDQTRSLRYPTRIPTGSAVLDSQRAAGLKCRTAPICEGHTKDSLTAKITAREMEQQQKKISCFRNLRSVETQECSQMTPRPPAPPPGFMWGHLRSVSLAWTFSHGWQCLIYAPFHFQI